MTTKVVSLNLVHGEVYSIQYYVIKFVSDLRQVDGSPVSLTNKNDHHDITEIFLKVALNTLMFCYFMLWLANKTFNKT
jgi:hypothetical protein